MQAAIETTEGSTRHDQMCHGENNNSRGITRDPVTGRRTEVSEEDLMDIDGRPSDDTRTRDYENDVELEPRHLG
jgi:hypothetical protein